MAMLRDETHGCPWDRKQTFRTIAPHTLEEAYEVVDAIEHEDYTHLANELGDLLFQIVFYAQLGKEAGYFDFDDIVGEIAGKLLNRHPHVFPGATMDSFGSEQKLTPAQVEGNWEQIKQSERVEKQGDGASVLDDIPIAFPALVRARKLQKRAAGAGFDWEDRDGVLDKLQEEMDEFRHALANQTRTQVEEELGDLFFTLVNLSRHLKVDPESCLRNANAKFEKRFRALERMAADDGRTPGSLSMDELEQYWQQAKRES